jgi:hypothetical protein
MIWNADGTYELEPAEQVAKDAFDEMADWGHSDALGWAHTKVWQTFGSDAPAIDAGFWEWLVWPGMVGPVVESPSDGKVWIPDLTEGK